MPPAPPDTTTVIASGSASPTEQVREGGQHRVGDDQGADQPAGGEQLSVSRDRVGQRGHTGAGRRFEQDRVVDQTDVLGRHCCRVRTDDPVGV